MQSTAAEVDDYIAAAPPERQPALHAWRALCRARLAGFEEAMAHGMPSYRRAGVVEIAFASQRSYLSLYVLRTDVVAAHRDRLAGLDVGKGCIRYPRPDRIDFDVVRTLLDATARSSGLVC